MPWWAEILGGASREGLPEKVAFERIEMREQALGVSGRQFHAEWAPNVKTVMFSPHSPSVTKNEQGVCMVRTERVGKMSRRWNWEVNKGLGYAEARDHGRFSALTLGEMGSLCQLFTYFLLILKATFNTLLYDAGAGTL